MGMIQDDTHLIRVSTAGSSRSDTSVTEAFERLHSWTWILGSRPYAIPLSAPTAPADRSHAVTLDFTVGATPTGIGCARLLIA
jgi:hypothetical protein